MDELQKELACALGAVKAAMAVCQRVQKQLVTADTLTKKDRSPVTVADFASQAIICAALAEKFPEDVVVGEEGSAELCRPEQSALCEAVVSHVQLARAGASKDDVLRWIDRGNADGSTKRYWTLDPIDGTKGFLRGEQYAVALALLIDHQVVLGVLGCPNLWQPGHTGTGCWLDARRGMGANQMYVERTTGDTLCDDVDVGRIREPREARFCESVESGHSDQSASQAIAQRLGITKPPLRMDSQVKYAAVARGDADIYLRLTKPDYRDCIWDHAAGAIIVEEAGGVVSDLAGKPLDFRHGRRLEANHGIVACPRAIHDSVIAAIGATIGGGSQK